MRQAAVIVGLIQRQLLPQTVLTLAQRGDTPPDRCHVLADGEVQALHKGRIDLPAKRGQHLLDRLVDLLT